MKEIVGVFDFLRDLSDEQLKACIYDKSYILTACPGSGKTRTIIYRLAYLSSKYARSNKYNIAITFTNRSANEIRDRIEGMGIEGSSIWSGTIHQFCLKFILRPYRLYSNRLKCGYTIIDEFVQEQYINEICQSLKMNAVAESITEKLKCQKVREAYYDLLSEKREIDFDLILTESFSLLRDYPFISKTLASIIRSIQVDEYQDTNIQQYKVISEIFKYDKEIQLSFVGDINQAIYRGLGGIALTKNKLDQLFGINFSELSLSGCYRSTQQIVEYYKKYQVVPGDIQAVSAIANHDSVITHDPKLDKVNLSNRIIEIVESQLSMGTPENEICILAPQWWMLFSIIKDLKDRLKHINFDAPALTPVKYDPLNPFYLIAKLLFTRPGRKTKHRKRLANELMEILASEFGIPIPSHIIAEDLLKIFNSTDELQDGMEKIRLAFQGMSCFLGITPALHKKLFDAHDFFIQKATDRIDRYNIDSSSDYFYHCFKERSGIVISTFHGIKGEEFDTVIAFGLLEGYVPHWDVIINCDYSEVLKTAKHLVYVICSRAKRNLYLISEQGHTTRSGNLYLPTEVIC